MDGDLPPPPPAHVGIVWLSRLAPAGLPQCQLPREWHARYALRPIVLESFCETPRFHGTCYRAANWIHLGQTRGRGKLDTRYQYFQLVKNMFVKPLCPDWQAILNR